MARGGGKILILCPTGQLVTAYRQRLGEDDSDAVVVETLDPGFHIARDADMSTFAAPGNLRRYDAIIIDEASQADDRVANLFLCGYRELPQKPALAVAADFQQLRHVGHGGGATSMQALTFSLRTFHFKSNHRTNDEVLKAFLALVRTQQPSKVAITDFFRGRVCLRLTWQSGAVDSKRATVAAIASRG